MENLDEETEIKLSKLMQSLCTIRSTGGKGKDVPSDQYIDPNRILNEMHGQYLYGEKNPAPKSFTKTN